jgi:FkbM family methyltransferase
LRRFCQSIASKCGVQLVRSSFGHHVWSDIAELNKRWNLPIKCVFDVGANIGQTSLSVLEYFSDAQVYSFEPHPDTFKMLRELLNDRRAHAFNIALGAKAGDGELFTYDIHVINSLTPTSPHAVHFGRTGQPIIVQVSTIDEFCSAYAIQNIDILKIDVEGCELDVLKGATETFNSQKIRFVYAEFNDILKQPGRTGGSLVPLCEFLKPFGLRFVASYTDYVEPDGEFFAVHNALFAASPSRPRSQGSGAEAAGI